MWLAGSLHEAVVATASRRGSLGKMGDYEAVLGEVSFAIAGRAPWGFSAGSECPPQSERAATAAADAADTASPIASPARKPSQWGRTSR